MKRFWLTPLLFCVICSCAAATSPVLAAAVKLNLPAPDGWPPHYPPALVRDVQSVNQGTGKPLNLALAYLVHRIDFEKLLIAAKERKGCAVRLEACRVDAIPGFWDSAGGRALLIGAGFVGGVGATTVIVIGVGAALGR